jgi:hypothetical protein
MTDMDIFEARFERAYRRYLSDAPTQVDAAAVASAVAVSRRPRLTGWTWPFRTDRPLVWIALATLLALALMGSLLAAGAARLLERPYPVVTGGPENGLAWLSRAVSGDELWTMDYDGLWRYVDGAWQGPLSPPPLGDESTLGLAVGPDGAFWVSGERTVAAFRDGVWRAVWKAAAPENSTYGLVVAPDGTIWVAQGRELIGLREEMTSYAALSVTCPRTINRIAATTDGAIYVGGFSYAGGWGLARSDGNTCTDLDPLGDGQVHEVADIAAGPAGSLAAVLFDEDGANGPNRAWVVILQDGHWSTITDPDGRAGVGLFGLAIAPDGHLWGIRPDQGLVRYENGGWHRVAESALSMAMAPDGVLWYATDRGIERIRTDRFGD